MTFRKNWITSDRYIPQRFVQPALRFTHVEAGSGIVLLIAAVAAMLWANLGIFGDSYFQFWQETKIDISIGPIELEKSLKKAVDEGLMAIFFFVMGLEIKRELITGYLRDRRKAVPPIAAALGGMALPALIYVFFNLGDSQALQGWGIPMATDIAFALGILALVGKSLPIGVRLFLLTVAVVDDIGAILVIALFYTHELHIDFLLAGLGALLLALIAARVNIRSYAFYAIFAIIAWYFFVKSGVHATIAGVALGLITPARPLYNSSEFDSNARRLMDLIPTKSNDPQYLNKVEHEAIMLSDLSRESVSPLWRIEKRLHGWSAFIIVPIFALANAGVRIVDVDLVGEITSNVSLGVAFALVFGNVIGIPLAAWAVTRLGIGRLPEGVTIQHLIGVGFLAGVGFTVSLFISELAFTDTLTTDLSKIGIFIGSIVAGTIGALYLRFLGSRS